EEITLVEGLGRPQNTIRSRPFSAAESIAEIVGIYPAPIKTSRPSADQIHGTALATASSQEWFSNRVEPDWFRAFRCARDFDSPNGQPGHLLSNSHRTSRRKWECLP